MTGLPTAAATVTITNKRGLHARASAKFVEAACGFRSEITVMRDGTTVSGRSIMGLMMLGVSSGATLEIRATGPDAELALQTLLALVAAGFHED